MADVKPSAGAAAEGAARGDSGASKQHHDSAVAGSLGAATASRPGRDDRLTSLRAIRAAEHKRTSSLTRMQSVSGGRRAGAGGEGSVSGAKPVIPASGRLLFGGTSLRFIQTDEMDVGNVIKQLLDCPDPNPDIAQGLVTGEFSFASEIEIAERMEKDANLTVNLQAAALGADAEMGVVEAQAEFPLELERKRQQLPCAQFVPSHFKREPLRELESFAPHEKLVRLEIALDIQPHPITMVWMDNLAMFLTAPQINALGRIFSRFVNCRALILRNAGLKKLDPFVLPALTYCDLESNKVSDLNQLLGFARRNPRIQALNMLGNPVAQTSSWRTALPEFTSDAWKLLLALPDLLLLNQHQLSMKDHMHAAKLRGNVRDRSRAELMQWDHAICTRVPDISSLMRWDPAAIQELHLGECELTTFHVGSLRALELLDLSGNKVESLLGTGLEKCDNLLALSLKGNPLRTWDSVETLGMLPSLRLLFLDDTPLSLTNRYRLRMIHLTRYARGTDQCAGLHTLDGTEVSFEERIQAITAFGKLKKRQLEEQHWLMALRAQLGQHAMRQPEFQEAVSAIRLQDFGLQHVDIRPFAQRLEILELRDNELRDVPGLRACATLRVLDLSGNRRLRVAAAITDLQRAPTRVLEVVSLAPTPQAVTQAHVDKVLMALMANNAALRLVDGVVPSLQQRLNAAQRGSLNLNRAELEIYRLHLALTVSATPVQGRRFLPADCEPGVQFQPQDVKALLRLSDLGLIDDVVSMARYVNLRKLNLSGNRIRDLSRLGLDALPHLRILDVSRNDIRMSLPDLGAWLNGREALQVFAIRKNPCVKSYEVSRLHLIGCIDRMRQITCDLRVIDREVTVAERVEGWRKAGGTEEAAEKLRADVALYLRTPHGVPPERITTLNLEDMQLRAIDLSAFVNLRVLRLRRNNLTSLAGIGIERMPALTALDLRENRLPAPDSALMRYFASASELRFLGLADRPTRNSDDKYRLRVCALIPRLRVVGCPLRFLDDEEISADEIVRSWRDGTQVDKERFRFNLVMFRACKGNPPSTLTEVDLSRRQLAFADFTMCTNLETVSLANNRLQTSTLQTSGLDRLPKLRRLDLSGNLFGSLERLASILDRLQGLEEVVLLGNKCFREDNDELRTRLLAGMKRSRRRGFCLKLLNGQPVTLPERCKGMERAGLKPEQLDKAKLSLTLEQMNMVPAQTQSLVLENCALRSVALLGLSGQFAQLTELNLSHNNFTQLRGQALHLLPCLALLDLRHNSFASLRGVVRQLERCAYLRKLYLKDSVTAGEAAKPDDYVPDVCSRLRALVSCDDVPNPTPMEPTEMAVAEFLLEFAGLSPNALVDVDLANRGLSKSGYFVLLNALAQLPSGTVQTLRLENNEWSGGVGPTDSDYRRYAVASLRRLASLDGLKVSDDERANALAALEREQAEFPDFLGFKQLCGSWEEPSHRDQAVRATDRDRRKRLEEEAKRARKNRGPGFKDPLRTGQKADRAGVVAQRAGGDALAGNARAQVTNAAVALTGLVPEVTGTLLNKTEILISFFQVYGLVLAINLDIDIELPDVWTQIQRVYSLVPNVLSVDLDLLFERIDINLGAYQSMAKFLGGLLCYFFFLLLYVTATSLDSSVWRRRYITQWPTTRARALAVWLFMLLASVAVGILVDLSSWDRILEGSLPTPRSNTIIAGAAGLVTAVALIWRIVIGVFRKYAGAEAESTAFIKFWSTWRRAFQRVSLFLLTVAYMPVSRMVLENFAPDYNHARLDVNGCAFSDETGRRCCLRIFPEYPCISSPDAYMSWLQLVALFAAVVVVLGLPLFFANLIRQGVRSVDLAGYGLKHQQYVAHLRVLKQELKECPARIRAEVDVEKRAAHYKRMQALKKQVKEVTQDLRNLYSFEVGKNPKAQSYLYQAYGRGSRYFKIVQMLEKVLLVCVALYVSDAVFSHLKGVAGGLVVVCITCMTAFARPFADWSEDAMEIMQRLTNSVNVLSSLSVVFNVLPKQAVAFLLIGANGANMVVFVLLVAIMPIRVCISNSRVRRRKAKQEQEMARRRQEQEMAKAQAKEQAKAQAAAAAPPPTSPGTASPTTGVASPVHVELSVIHPAAAAGGQFRIMADEPLSADADEDADLGDDEGDAKLDMEGDGEVDVFADDVDDEYDGKPTGGDEFEEDEVDGYNPRASVDLGSQGIGLAAAAR